MLLNIYTTGDKGELLSKLSLYSAEPKDIIKLPDGEEVPVFDYKNFPFQIFKDAPKRKKKGKTLDRIAYYDLACSYDIESTTIINTERPFAFMYHWQICIEDYVFFGRTWEEFVDFNDTITRALECEIYKDGEELHGTSLVYYVHNLNYEFQFSSWFMGDFINPMFTDKYCPLIVPCAIGITYRCSYRLSNKSLDKFTDKMPHHKLTGTFDYTKIRTSKSQLTNLEKAYCYCDVRSLSEAIRDRLTKDKYNIASIPLTSTGYVRKDARLEMRKNKKNRDRFIESKLDDHLYKLCRLAFRGGNTHANALYIGDHLHNVKSWDLVSSYPAWILTKTYPIGKFEKVANTATLLDNLDSICKKYCLLVTIRLHDFEYIGKCGVPYISESKTLIRVDDLKKCKIDNGRIVECPFAQLTLTELDLKIVLRDYSFSKIEIIECYRSWRGMLPQELRSVVMGYYKQKTALKGIEDPEGINQYNYARQKEYLNAGYGMMVQRVDHFKYDYIDHEYIPVKQTLQEQLDEFYSSRSSFLSYQHGVWVCAWARYVLQLGLDIAGEDTVYCDTDSVKYIGDHEQQFEELNEKLIANAVKAGAVAKNKDGKEFPIGIYDQEKTYTDFKTLRSKCYIYSYDNGKTIHATISGVDKKTGAEYFTKNGFEALHDGTSIDISGKVSAKYNNDRPHFIEINGVKMLTASNIALIPSAYTVKLDKSHVAFVETMKKTVKKFYEK